MARVAVSVVGPQDLPDDVLRRAASTLAAQLDLIAIGPVVRDGDRAALVAVARSDSGPASLARMLQRLSAETFYEYRLLAYGALIYRSEGMSVPPSDVEAILPALESLHRLDPGFKIPLLGNVTAHLGRDTDRPHS